MTSKLEPRHLLRDGQASVTWFVRLPPGTSYEDVMRPGLWRGVAEKVNVRDLVRVVGPNLEFDVMCVVTGKAAGGLRLEEFPIRPTAADQKDHPTT